MILKASIKTSIGFLTCCIFTLSAKAQIPTYDIYKLDTRGNNYFDATHYAKQILNMWDYYTVKISLNKEVTQYGLTYALVSLDTINKNGILKIALLRDTVSNEGIKANKYLTEHPLVYYNNDWEPIFCKEYTIKEDTISEDQLGDEYFPEEHTLTAQWIFSNKFQDNFIGLINSPIVNRTMKYDSLAHRYLQGNTYDFGQAFFLSYNTGNLPYHDLRFTYDKDHIPVYATSAPTVKIKTYFGKGEFIAVRKDSANWLAVDRVLILPDTNRYYLPDEGTIEGNSKLNIIHGWVKKEDLVDNPWVKQKEQNNEFRFEVSGTPKDNEDYTNSGSVQGIKIINKKTGAKQIIMDIGANLQDTINNVVQLVDANFDGYPDIEIPFQTGGAGPNYTDNYYLYNPKNGQFEYNDDLSNVSQIEVNEQSKTITSTWRNGAAEHGGETYTMKDGKLHKIASWDQNCGQGIFCNESHSNLVNGKWLVKFIKTGPINTDSLIIYSASNKQSKAIIQLKTDDWVTVKEETPLWMKVEAEKTIGNSYKTFTGWIAKEDFFVPNWIKVAAETPLYHFEISDSSSINAIKVINKKNEKTFQILFTENPSDATDSLFQTGDFNADGMPDFRLETYSDENKIHYDYYLFDKTKGIFELDRKWSE